MSESDGGFIRFAREHPTVVGASMLLTYSGLKLSAIAAGDVAVLLALARTVGTGSVLLASVAQLVALVAFPGLVFIFGGAAVLGLARAVTVPAGIGVFFWSLAAAPWWLLALSLVALAAFAWTNNAPAGSRRHRIDRYVSRPASRTTALALTASMFVMLACALPIAPGEVVALRDGSRLVGETYGVHDGLLVVLLEDADLRMVPVDQIAARRLCRRGGDSNWDSVLTRLGHQRLPCAQVANQPNGGDAAGSDEPSANRRE